MPDVKEMHLVSRCLVNQRRAIVRNAERLRRLHDAVGDRTSASLSQMVQFHALALEYRPDLTIEFGRLHGNSTVAFTESAHSGNPDSRVFSMCNSTAWEKQTVPKLREFLPESWFDPLQAFRVDIRDVDMADVVGDAQRVLVLWDAHGVDVAECVLARLMPVLANREHFVIIHDISDSRYCGSPNSYHGLPLWRGRSGSWKSRTARLRLGWIDTCVEQTICAIDFLTRNGLELGSADHVLKTEGASDPNCLAELRKDFPQDFVSDLYHWAFFSLNDVCGPYHFPAYPAGNQGAALAEIRQDLDRSRLLGMRTPFTYGRVITKVVTGRYPGLFARKAG